MPSSDIRSSEISTQNAGGKNFHSSCVQIFVVVFRGSYFHVLAVGHENREDLDLAKIYNSIRNLPVEIITEEIALKVACNIFPHRCIQYCGLINVQ